MNILFYLALWITLYGWISYRQAGEILEGRKTSLLEYSGTGIVLGYLIYHILKITKYQYNFKYPKAFYDYTLLVIFVLAIIAPTTISFLANNVLARKIKGKKPLAAIGCILGFIYLISFLFYSLITEGK